MFSKLKPILTHKYFPILLLICLNLILGFIIVNDYGESWDEHIRYRYGKSSLAAYTGNKGDVKDEKGPFFVMVAVMGGDLLQNLRQDWLVGDARHFMIFVFFLVGLFFLYRLCYRYTNKWAAFGAVLMFNTQPLLWGHAFINPKDIPFMALFIASVDLGLNMADLFIANPVAQQIDDNLGKPWISLRAIFSKEWRQTSGWKWVLVVGYVVASIAFLFVFLTGDGVLPQLITELIQQAYSASPNEVLGQLFGFLAENAQDVPVDAYIQKAMKIYPLLVLFYVFIAAILAYVIFRKLFPDTESFFRVSIVLPFIRRVWARMKDGNVLAAGVLLGLVSSIRILGPASGLLIAAYLMVKMRRKSIPTLVAYFTIGVLITYLTWPGLWNAPLDNFMRSASKAANFPWEGKVMFAGRDLGAGELPRVYLPTLLSIQFTMTAMLVILVGFVTAIADVIRKTLEWEKFAVILLWFFAPFAGAIIMQPTFYDNFRQFLFTIPPLFVFAAFGFKFIYSLIPKRILYFCIVLLLITPNLYWIVKLHPYQYVYYNILVGGVQGAFRNYEMDYWGTSYREATEYINEVAPPDSHVIVWGAVHLVRPYARQDLTLVDFRKFTPSDEKVSTYAIISSRHDKDLYLYPTAEQVHIVGREGAIYAVVKQVNPYDMAEP